MKKVFVILALALTSLMYVGCTDYSDDIQDLQNQINSLSSDKIKSVSDQVTSIQSSITTLQNADTQLQSYITELKNQIAALQSADKAVADQIAEYITALTPVLEALQAKDEALQKQINDLKAYVDTQINDTKTWADNTFATLDQYKETAAVIADIKAQMEKVSTITGPVSQEDLTKAIAASETSIQDWVHSLLKGYYTAEQADAKLATFKDELTADVAKSYEEKTAKVKEEVTEAYKAAIKTAIEEYNGTITATIAAEIATVNGKVEALIEDVADLQSRVSKLEDRVSLLEQLLGVKWSVKGTVNDGAGNDWNVTLVAWNNGAYTIKDWYNVAGYDLEFVANEDGTISVTNYYADYLPQIWVESGDDVDNGWVNIYTAGGYSSLSGDKEKGDLWFYNYRTSGYYELTWPAVTSQGVTVDELVGTYAQNNTYQFYTDAWGNYSSDNDITITKVDDNTVAIDGFMYSAEDNGKILNATVDAENGILTIEPQMIDEWYKLAGQGAETDAVKVYYTGNGTLVFGKWCAWYGGYAYGYSNETILTKK